MEKSSAKAYQMYIGGKWSVSESGRTFEAINPATGEVIATLPEGTRKDAQQAIQIANEKKHLMADMPIWERSRLCLRISEEMEKRREELARTLTEDQGKPYHAEALGEVDVAAHGFRMAAEQIKWLETSVIPTENPSKRVFSFYRPRGVYAVVTPWNFPINIPVEYLAPGLAAGNSIVWVPAPTTSVCAVKLMECMVEAGIPEGAVNLITGPGAVVGDEIVSNPGTDGVCFTGSTATGSLIAQRGAGKPLLLEQGGNGPTVVLDDADLEWACKAISFGCFFNAGQVCSATGRILVQRSVHEEMVERLVKAAQEVRIGDPFDQNTTMGPLNNQNTLLKIDEHIEDGKNKGASILFGGGRSENFKEGLFYEPTVIDNITSDSLLNRAETFGPVAPFLVFDSDEEGLKLALDSPYGLVSCVFTSQTKRGFYFAERMQSGIVNINDSSNYWETHIPFGGGSGTDSGVGRLGGKHTLMAMSDLRTISLDVNY